MRRRALSLGALAFATFSFAVACGTESREDFDPNADGGLSATSSGASGQQSTPPISGDDASPPLVGPGKTTLNGITYAPNGTLPLAGVLVYETDTPPAPIPEGVYCDSCRVLPAGTFVQSAADGTFQLMGHAGTRYLVTEKGQFRRVRKIEVGADGTVQEIEHAVTTLPGSTAAGAEGQDDTIARIALMDEQGGDGDSIQVVLQGLGISEWTSFGDDLGKVSDDSLQKFHVALFPCDNSSLNKPRAAEKQALRNFVQAGGKIYGSDWSHMYVDETFPEFFKRANQTWTDTRGAESPSGRFDDVGMSAWLANVSPGENPADTEFQGVWSYSNGVKAADVPDANGGTHTVTPHVYASVTETATFYASPEAATSVEFGCGRALLSTFHVHGGTSSNLLMQEKALLYMLLDVSTCIGEPGVGGPVN